MPGTAELALGAKATFSATPIARGKPHSLLLCKAGALTAVFPIEPSPGEQALNLVLFLLTRLKEATIPFKRKKKNIPALVKIKN